MLLLGPSETIEQGTIIWVKGKDNLYRQREKLTMTKGHTVFECKVGLTRKEIGETLEDSL